MSSPDLSRHRRRAGIDPEALAQPASPHYLARLVPCLEPIACTLLYALIPNCAVRWRDGALGAGWRRSRSKSSVGFVLYRHAPTRRSMARCRHPHFPLWMYVSWLVLLGAVVGKPRPGGSTSGRPSDQRGASGFSLAPTLSRRAPRARATCRTRPGDRARVPTSSPHSSARTRRFTAATQDGGWVRLSPETVTLHDLYPRSICRSPALAGVAGRRGRCSRPGHGRDVAEAAAMRVTLAVILPRSGLR
jgi:hypothetical protein